MTGLSRVGRGSQLNKQKFLDKMMKHRPRKSQQKLKLFEASIFQIQAKGIRIDRKLSQFFNDFLQAKLQVAYLYQLAFLHLLSILL